MILKHRYSHLLLILILFNLEIRAWLVVFEYNSSYNISDLLIEMGEKTPLCVHGGGITELIHVRCIHIYFYKNREGHYYHNTFII
jgi:hypothetical protein